MRDSNDNQGCLVMLGIGICVFTTFTFLNTDRYGARWAVCMFLFIITPMFALFIHVMQEVEEQTRKGEELRREREQKAFDEAKRQREELARREWEQTPEGQAFLEQQRHEVNEKERVETELRQKEAEEREQAQKQQAERAARETWRKWHEFKTPSEIAEMSGLEFEAFLYRLLTKMGYTGLQLTPINDQGGDLVGDSPETIRTVVQAKRWKNKLGNAVVQELLGAMLHYDAAAGMVITNSTFTEAARQLAAKDKRITLCDGPWLIAQIRQFLPPEIPEFDWAIYNATIAPNKMGDNHTRTNIAAKNDLDAEVAAKLVRAEIAPEKTLESRVTHNGDPRCQLTPAEVVYVQKDGSKIVQRYKPREAN